MKESKIMAVYGITAESEEVEEYVKIEMAEKEDGGMNVIYDIREAILAAESADDGQTLNPWFNDRQVEIIISYMDGMFGTALLTSEKRPDVYSQDALLGWLVAACDSRFIEWRDNLDALLERAQKQMDECRKEKDKPSM